QIHRHQPPSVLAIACAMRSITSGWYRKIPTPTATAMNDAKATTSRRIRNRRAATPRTARKMLPKKVVMNSRSANPSTGSSLSFRGIVRMRTLGVLPRGARVGGEARHVPAVALPHHPQAVRLVNDGVTGTPPHVGN